MSVCPCPKHPIGCYGHPFQCGCADAEKTKDAEIESLRARLAEVEGERDEMWAVIYAPGSPGTEVNHHHVMSVLKGYLSDFQYSLARATSSEKTVRELREGLERAEYLIDRYRTLHSGKPVRDLEEAEENFCRARSITERRDG